jgi:acyl-CoA reductase-like NAD-dependent aldehyde dehydrogenase
MSARFGLVIDGEVRSGDAGSYPVSNPVRPDETVLQAPSASLEQLDLAVAAARRAQPAWAALPVEARCARVSAAAELARVAVETGDLARWLTREHGKVLWEAQFDAGTLGGMAGAFSPLAGRALAPHSTGSEAGPRTLVEHVPYGVVGTIIPFNWPVAVFGNKVLPALLAGNAVVVKAPPTCPGALLAAAAALAGELEPGLLNVVNGPGQELGEAIVSHPGIDMVSFTGGVTSGRAVMALAARATKPVVLELGGNDPAILAPDVEVDAALADRIVGAAFLTSGQVCMAVKRLYVPSGSIPAVVEALVDRVATEVVGDGLRPEVTMGPVHSRGARERAEGMLDEVAAAGCRVHRPAVVRDDDAAAGGHLVAPAIVEDPPKAAAIVTTEQFAPILPVVGYRDLDDAVAQANDSPFGLCASVWTVDPALAASLSRRLEAGTVFVNDHGMGAMDHLAPFGGWKASGFGLELGDEGMRAYTRTRVVRGFPAEQR